MNVVIKKLEVILIEDEMTEVWDSLATCIKDQLVCQSNQSNFIQVKGAQREQGRPRRGSYEAMKG